MLVDGGCHLTVGGLSQGATIIGSMRPTNRETRGFATVEVDVGDYVANVSCNTKASHS